MTAPKQTRPIASILRTGLGGLIPFLLFLSALRLTLTPMYLRAAYAVPGFPEDIYGFSAEQRLRHAEIARQYLLNDQGIDFLGEQTFEDGSQLYNQRELRHMEDVKELTQIVLDSWLVLLVLLAAGLVVVYRLSGEQGLGELFSLAGKVTLIGMLVLGLALAVSFPFVFVGFHRIFFEGDSWLFRYSDTLIRLFPERFWQQVFVFLTTVTAALAFALRWLGKKLKASVPEA